MDRLTKRNSNGVAYMSIAETLAKWEQEIEGSQAILEGVYAIFQKLAEYEDLEEQGSLIKLPCKVGEVVYLLSSPMNVTNFEEEFNEEDILIFECEVQSITQYPNDESQIRLRWNNKFVGYYLTPEHFGKIIFLTREEAEKALKESEEK